MVSRGDAIRIDLGAKFPKPMFGMGLRNSRERRWSSRWAWAPLKGETYGCFKIQEPDARSACLGEAKGDQSYCFKIEGADERNACLAEVKADRSYCFKIQGKDLRNHCLANTPR